jgi:hypothetical protein
MERWRELALGEDAPWLPTLVEVKDGEVRAWTGLKMGVRLSLVLGPAATWRLMQALGEVIGASEAPKAPTGRAVAGLSRGRFLKGLAGGIFAVVALPAGKALASPYERVGGISGAKRVSPKAAVIGRLKRFRAVRAATGIFGRPDWRRVEKARYAEGGTQQTVYLIPYRSEAESQASETAYLVVEDKNSGDAQGIVMRLHHGDDGDAEAFSWYLPGGQFIATTEVRDGEMVERRSYTSQKDSYQVQSCFRVCFVICLGANGRRCIRPCRSCGGFSCALCFACGGIYAVRCARRCRRRC